MKLIISLLPLLAGCALAGEENTFSNFYQGVVQNKQDENVVFSPIAIASSVALLLFGAGGTTEKEMLESLGFTIESKYNMTDSWGRFIKENVTANASNGLQLATKMYVNNNVEVKPDFANFASYYFGADPETLNFTNSADTIQRINSWFSNHTQNAINNIVGPSDIYPAMLSIIINAIYFKGNWDNPFNTFLTKKSEFRINTSDNVTTDFISNSGQFKYLESEEYDATAVILPYLKSNLSMMIILPNKVDGLEELEKNIPLDQIQNIVDNMNLTKVDIVIPKFKFEYAFDLKQPLTEMGMPNVFSSIADFSGIFVSSPFVGTKAIHKAFISVDEHGTEAVASTVLKFVPVSAPRGEIKRFNADHPFAFYIFQGPIIYFAGHVVKF